MPGNPTLTIFNNQNPPWLLAQLDSNFSSIASIINSANNYTNYLPDTGVANAYAVTFPAGVVVTLTANLGIWFKVSNTNTGSSTLNVNATGAKNLVTNNGSALSSGMLAAGGVYFAIYDGTNYQVANPTVASAGSVAGVASRRQTVLIGPTDINGNPNILPQSVTGLNLTTQNIISVETVYTANVTTPVASPGVVTWTGHTLVANQAVSFTTSGALPTGLTAGTTYYVLNPAANTFNVSATPGGAAINFTGSTSGQSVAWGGVQNVLTVTAFAGNDGIVGEINFTGITSSNLTWTGLTNTSTNYLYVLVSPNGVLTPAFTTLAPIVVYGSTTAPSITSGQITINLTLSESYLGNGVSAVETPIALVGTATTSGGNITATSVYSYGQNPLSFITSTGANANVYHGKAAFTSNGTWLCPPGVIRAKVYGCSPGGNGGNGGGGSGGGGGGGGGPGVPFESDWLTVVPGTPYSVTINGGGPASFGVLYSKTGGGTGGNGILNVGGAGGTLGSPVVGVGGIGGVGPGNGNGGGSIFYAPGSGGIGTSSPALYGGGGGGGSSFYASGGNGANGGAWGNGGGGGGAGDSAGASAVGTFTGAAGGNGRMTIEW